MTTKFVIESKDEKEKTITLRLEEVYKNEITIIGTDGNGNEWEIITFLENGKFKRHRHIDSNVGITVDNKGFIEEEIHEK